MANTFISIVVAAYNEEAILGDTLQRLVAELEAHPGLRWEIVCVNDGSSDGTGAIMGAFAARESRLRGLHHRRNRGQGRALRTGFEASQGEVVVTMDADLSYHPRYIFALLEALERHDADIALASAYTPQGSARNVPAHRLMLSRAGNAYLRFFSRSGIYTSTCVVRAYRRDALDQLILTSDGMELQIEILSRAHLLNFRIVEIPATLEWAQRKVDAVKAARTSKMRIFRAIRYYLLMGWIARPAKVFLLLSLLLLLPGLLKAPFLIGSFLVDIVAWWPQKGIMAISVALQALYFEQSYALVLYGGTMLLGFALFCFSLVLLQCQKYYEENYKVQVQNRALLQKILNSKQALRNE